MDEVSRFWSRVTGRGTNGCWEWAAGKSNGYGRFPLGGGKCAYAHRYSYELLVGPIPEGLHIDHLCRNRACVNPHHLEPVTLHVNNTRAGLVVTHCKKGGHRYSEENVLWNGSGRACKVCSRMRSWHRSQRHIYTLDELEPILIERYNAA